MSYDKRFGNIEAIFYALEGRFCLECIKQRNRNVVGIRFQTGIPYRPFSFGVNLYRLIFIDSDGRYVKARG